MPCDHRFHDESLLPWLELHNNCPVCRKEIDGDEALRHRQIGDGAGGAGGSGGAGGCGPRPPPRGDDGHPPMRQGVDDWYYS
eukprot:EC786164.1.p4 GENE.EC786164.1~~EC786164.1.p4  ORF type:complete len:82 (+),score=16.21 EC786164.1:214-459(+)